MKKIKKLKEVMRKHNFLSAVPYANNLIIDNTSLSPGRTARMIQKYSVYNKVGKDNTCVWYYIDMLFHYVAADTEGKNDGRGF